jgi:hypothetical protein
METLGALTALGSQVTIGGEAYCLRPLTRRDWALIEERIISQRGDPIEAAKRLAKDAPEAIARSLLEDAYRDAKRAQAVTAGELDAWRVTLDGVVFQFWLQVRKERPEITEDRAGELLEQFGAEFIERVTAELLAKFPEATREDVAAVAMEEEEGAAAALIAKGLGMPSGNSPTPETPGTPTESSTGPSGTPNSGSYTDGPSSKSTA